MKLFGMKKVQRNKKYIVAIILYMFLFFIGGCPGDWFWNDLPHYKHSFLMKLIFWLAGWLIGVVVIFFMGIANDTKTIEHYDLDGEYLGHSKEEIPDSGDFKLGVLAAKVWFFGYPSFYLIYWVWSLF